MIVNYDDIETLGPFGPSALEVVDLIAQRIRKRSGDSFARSRLVRRLAAAVQSGNAARVLEAHGRVRPGSITR